MKTLLVALVALTMTTAAFAESMVKLEGCATGVCNGLDFDQESDDKGNDDKSEDSRIALNYAMTFAGNFGAGITFIQETDKFNGDKAAAADAEDTIGLSFYWNKDGSFSDSCFAALHYDMVTASENDGAGDDDYKDTNITLEYGHRYGLGKVAGVTMNWVPSITYAMESRAYGTEVTGTTEDFKTTHINLNFANFAATF